MIYFTSDTHWGHANILEYDQRPFATIAEHDEALVQYWNETVKPGDVVYHLGDVAWRQSAEEIDRLLHRLHGTKILITGNHDSTKVTKSPRWSHVTPYHEAKRQGQLICLFHYRMTVWNRSHHGSWALHGHCVDQETELLTLGGWKRYHDVVVGDPIYSYNPETGFVEEDVVLDRHVYPDADGWRYRFQSKCVDYCVTDQHRMVALDASRRYCVAPAKEFCEGPRRWLISSCGREVGVGLPLSDDELAVYVWLAADGSIVNTDLGRIRVMKKRKQAAVEQLLQRVVNAYSKNSQADGSVCFNFTIPPSILRLQIKGLDWALLSMTRSQVAVLLKAYAQSDGTPNGSGLIVYSAKEREIDILQAVCVTNGYRATKYARNHGFSMNQQFQLTITPNQVVQTNHGKRAIKERFSELMWCVTTQNHNWFCRRNGKVHLTGNSHGSLPEIFTAKTLDVGTMCWNYRPVSFEQLEAAMAVRIWTPVDQHGVTRR